MMKKLLNFKITKLFNPEKFSNSVIQTFSNSGGSSKPASSLIFVMLIVAGIVTVTLGTQRLALVQFGQSVADEDNIAAYYAAKAGIEDGLNRFRFARNASTIRRDGSGTLLSTAERYDITTGLSVGNVSDNTSITSAASYKPTDQYYDLKIDYKTANGTLTLPSPIAQDDTLELTGFPDTGTDYYLRYQLTWTAPNSGCFVTLQQISQTTTGTQSFPQVIASQIGSQLTLDSAASTNMLIRSVSGGVVANFVRIRPYGTAVIGSSCYNGGAVSVNFSTVNGPTSVVPLGVNFDSNITSITATGYVGTTKRTLLATVDRKSGTLISVYDFNVYGGTGSVTP